MLPNFRGDDLDECGAGKHPRLDDIAADVSDANLDLKNNKLGRHLHHPINARGVLRRERRNRRHAKRAKRRNRFQVGLDACPTPGVGTSDD